MDDQSGHFKNSFDKNVFTFLTSSAAIFVMPVPPFHFLISSG